MRTNTHTVKSDNIASEAYKAKAEEVIFEIEPSKEGGRFQDHLILLYGMVKIGKTTLATYFPGVYFLVTEPGYKAQLIRKSRIPNWTSFRWFVEWAEDNPRTIRDILVWCIDTTTNLSKFCMSWVCGRDGITHPSDQDWGKGWEAFSDEFSHWILRLAAIGKGILFICHEKEREVVSRRMKITKYSPDLPNTTYRIINNLADIIMQMGYVERSRHESELGEMRCLYTKPVEIRDAGDRTGRLPEVIKFETEREAVRKILSCFESENRDRNRRPERRERTRR